MNEPSIQQMYDDAVRLHQAGRLDEAEAAYREVLGRKENADVLHMLGVVVGQIGRTEEALELVGRAIALNPKSAKYHYNIGLILKKAARAGEAIDAFGRAVALDGNFADAWRSLGDLLQEMGRFEEALAAYRRAVALKPGHVEAHNNLGMTLASLGRADEAAAEFREALRLRPSYAKAFNNLANALIDIAPLSEAIACYRRALEIEPDFVECHSNLAMMVHYEEHFDAARILRELRGWDRVHGEPLRHLIGGHENDRDPDRRLRVGYVSPDFKEHAVGWNILPLVLHRDRERFEIFCYSNCGKEDSVREQYRASADGWRDILDVSDEEAARMIRGDKVDILVDLTGHVGHNRLGLFARKPAPVQVTFGGYPGGTGLKAMDYHLTDPYLDPPGESENHYVEHLVRLPDSFWCYDPKSMGVEDLEVGPLAALAAGRATFGCLNTYFKISDRTLALWSRVLGAVPDSRLLLIARRVCHRKLLLSKLANGGVEEGRVVFVEYQPKRQYMETYHRIDIVLDTLPYNGHTTSLDALWMGVPVVTQVGKTAVGRGGWSQANNLGLTELAAWSEDEFVQIARDLATDLPRLGELRAGMRRRMLGSPLTDAKRFARNIESAYRQMWRDWCLAGR